MFEESTTASHVLTQEATSPSTAVQQFKLAQDLTQAPSASLGAKRSHPAAPVPVLAQPDASFQTVGMTAIARQQDAETDYDTGWEEF